ncbi:MAG: hypothetical protein N2483_07210 [Burkholderiaceae bacterium]|nr:hypothetical protein [Burkholderiaceae bacterium]
MPARGASGLSKTPPALRPVVRTWSVSAIDVTGVDGEGLAALGAMSPSDAPPHAGGNGVPQLGCLAKKEGGARLQRARLSLLRRWRTAPAAAGR